MIALLKRLLLGDLMLKQTDLPLFEPQTERSVWLTGAGDRQDVTHRHTIACASPLTICLPVGDGGEAFPKKAALEVWQTGNTPRRLARIGLRLSETLPTDGGTFALCTVTGCSDGQWTVLRFWAQWVQRAFWRWRDRKRANVHLNLTDSHAMNALFFCPRPVVLVSTQQGEQGNLFPMNLMGSLGGESFGFALIRERYGAKSVKAAERIVLSSIPFEDAEKARALGVQHLRESVVWAELPFAVDRGMGFGVPVPAFASRVREVAVVERRELGSHTFFLSRVVRDEAYRRCEGFFMVQEFVRRT